MVSIHASRCWEAMPLLAGKVDDATLVSIHASRCWEAMPVQVHRPDRQRTGFNPRLPLLGGDAIDTQGSDDPSYVSIHASRCWEAMPTHLGARVKDLQVSIHASRCWEAMPS